MRSNFFGDCFQTPLGSEKHCLLNTFLRSVIHGIETEQLNSMSQCVFRFLFPKTFKFRKILIFEYVPKHCNSCYKQLSNYPKWAKCFRRLLSQTFNFRKHWFVGMFLSTVTHTTKTWQVNTMSQFCLLFFPNTFRSRRILMFQWVPNNCNSYFEEWLINSRNRFFNYCFRTHLNSKKNYVPEHCNSYNRQLTN